MKYMCRTITLYQLLLDNNGRVFEDEEESAQDDDEATDDDDDLIEDSELDEFDYSD